MEEIKVSFVEAELTKISLDPGDMLSVKIIDRDMDQDSLMGFQNGLQALFPNNRVLVFVFPPESSISFTKIKSDQSVGCGPQTCVDCNCGKAQDLKGE